MKDQRIPTGSKVLFAQQVCNSIAGKNYQATGNSKYFRTNTV